MADDQTNSNMNFFYRVCFLGLISSCNSNKAFRALKPGEVFVVFLIKIFEAVETSVLVLVSHGAHQSLLSGFVNPWISLHRQPRPSPRREASVECCVGDLVRVLWSADFQDWREVSRRCDSDLHL
jgi:hypothetical protein